MMKLCSPLTVLKQPRFAWGCEVLMEAGKAAKGLEIISVLWGKTSGSIEIRRIKKKEKKKGCILKESSTPLDHAMCSKALIDTKVMQGLGLGLDLGFSSSAMYHFHVSVHLHLPGVAQPCMCELEGMSCVRSALLSTNRVCYRPAQHRRGWRHGAAGMSSSHIHPLFHWILC